MTALLLPVVLMMAGLADEAERPVRRMVFYRGTVQGVGFRATAVALRGELPVNGWVRNLADGRVQLLVEGTPKAVNELLTAIRGRWRDQLTHIETTEQAAAGDLMGFRIQE